MTRTGNIRNILLIGRTNSGKSTLANVLVNEVDQENKFKNFEQIFKEGEGGAESTTQAIQKDNFEYNGIKYQIIDTIGIGDTKLTPVETIEKLLTMFSEIKGGVNQVFFIVKESFTQEQVFFLDSLADIFFGDDFVKYVTIVKTNAKFFKNEKKCEEDVEKMKGKSTRIDALINNKKIIHVDNKSIPEIDPDDSGNESEIRECQKYRSRSRKIVVNHLAENCQDSCQINSIFDFLNSFKENNELNTESLRKSIKRTEENKSEIDSIVSKFMEDVKKIKESKGNFSSLELSEKSLLAAETVVVVGSAIAASALIGAVVPKTEPVDIVEPICSTLGEMAGERERKKWEEHWGAKRKENWEKWIKVLNEEDKEIEKLFNRLNSLDVTGCSKNNFNSVRSKMRSFIERSENLLNNLPEQLSGDYKDKESSEFVKEFVELKEEINKILLSQKEAYQDSINYTEKIISFLSKMEMMDKTNQTHVPLTEILPK